MSDKKVQIDDLLKIISDVSSEDVPKERAELEKNGINFSKLDEGLNKILDQAKEAKPSWLAAAADKRKRFQDIIEKSQERINLNLVEVKKTFEDIKSGKYGNLPQQKLLMQFRNKSSNEITEQELINFLKDQELLRILGENKDE